MAEPLIPVPRFPKSSPGSFSWKLGLPRTSKSTPAFRHFHTFFAPAFGVADATNQALVDRSSRLILGASDRTRDRFFSETNLSRQPFPLSEVLRGIHQIPEKPFPPSLPQFLFASDYSLRSAFSGGSG
jgi:hypothetical protein